MLKIIILPTDIVAMAAFNDLPLDTVSSTQPFDLNGATVPTAEIDAVSLVPVPAGPKR